MSWIWAAERAALILPEKCLKTDSRKSHLSQPCAGRYPFDAVSLPLRRRPTAETLGSNTRAKVSPHGGASPLRWIRKRHAHRSLPRDLFPSTPDAFLRKARPVITQGGLSAFHPLFVIIRTRRRTNHQTPHSLSRPAPINHQPTSRLPAPASHRCPRQRKTDQAKNAPTGSPPPNTTDFCAP